MLLRSNIDPLECLERFSASSIEVALIVPTETALKKSIIDATANLRAFLFDNQLHDFSMQLQGKEHKQIIDLVYISVTGIHRTKMSLYRPSTKEGDPRLWVYRLNADCSPYDLLAFFVNGSELVAVNCSQIMLDQLIHKGEIASAKTGLIVDTYCIHKKTSESDTYKELESKLINICRKGFIPLMRTGATGIGYTLETLLGIAANSSKAPDYKGIEIKSGKPKGKRGQYALFSKTPNWKKSRLNELQLLKLRGRYSESKSRVQLYHELFCDRPNSYDMFLEIDDESNLLYQSYKRGVQKDRDVLWEIEVLKKSLLEKHKETVWVEGLIRSDNGQSSCHYHKLQHTLSPKVNQLPILIGTGAITVHYTLHLKPNGKPRNHGYLFKMSPKYMDILFGSRNQKNLVELARST